MLFLEIPQLHLLGSSSVIFLRENVIYTAFRSSAFKLTSDYETITHRSVEEYIHNWKIKNFLIKIRAHNPGGKS